MRSAETFHMSFETAERVRNAAEHLRVTQGDLLEHLVSVGFKASGGVAGLEKWADDTRAKAAREATTAKGLQGLSGSASRALAGLGPQWLAFEALRAATSLGEAVGWRALVELEQRGLVQRQVAPGAALHPKTGRPLRSLWRRVD